MSLYDEVHHKYKLACTELREATDALDDPAVNNIRTLPEGIRLLRADNERLRGGLRLIADDTHRLMNETARQTAASILGGKPIGATDQPHDNSANVSVRNPVQLSTVAVRQEGER